MAYTGKQLYDMIQPKTRAQYERAFDKARKAGYVDRMSLKHKWAVIKLAYTLWVSKPASKRNTLDKCLYAACKINRDELYKLLSKTHVWQSDQWIEKWHIESAKDLIARGST